ncbi:cytochrome o ubiquinol oxidase subunit IV [Psychrobacter sp. B38]|uniref:cytochrome o ubiquinol oxidase subunit IV n=1 Tax=Psychrobacter sp. B38 TaxID=3143538 RepID=UPI00320C9CBA
MKNENLHAAEQAHAHGDVSHGQSSHGSKKSYIIGFVLSAILTVIPFGLIMSDMMSGMSAIWMIAVFAAAQVFVQVYFFLHVDFSPEQRNTLYSFLFTLFVVAIVMVGSLWIMHNANENMMPGMGKDMQMDMGMKMPTNADGTPRLDRELEGFEDKLDLPDTYQAPNQGSPATTQQEDHSDMSDHSGMAEMQQ